MQAVTLARNAMATRFELVLYGEDPVALRAAGEEALSEVARLEARLSLYQSGSEIAHVNARAAHEAVQVTPEVFGLLEHAQKLHLETEGAFDITIAPLVRCWGFMGGNGHLPDPVLLAEARAKIGMQLVELDKQNFQVRFAREGVMLDLGAIGKGYAIERAAEFLREAGVSSALLHSGTSTSYALGHPPDAESWKLAITGVSQSAGNATTNPEQAAPGTSEPPPLTMLSLKDASLSVSAVWGKCFVADGKTLGHVLDPRSGYPTAAAVLSAVVLPSATETDALSTALLIRGEEGFEKVSQLRPGMRTLLAFESEGKLCVKGKEISEDRE